MKTIGHIATVLALLLGLAPVAAYAQPDSGSVIEHHSTAHSIGAKRP
jgi:hypothetical protein